MDNSELFDIISESGLISEEDLKYCLEQNGFSNEFFSEQGVADSVTPFLLPFL